MIEERWLARVRRARLALVSLLALTCFSTGCSRANRDPVEIVPLGSLWILTADWNVVSGSDNLRALVQVDSLNRMFADIRVPPRLVSRVVIFQERKPGLGDATGMLVSGGFDENRTLAALRSGGWEPDDAEPRRVLHNPVSATCVAAPGWGVLAVGDRDAVHDVLRAVRDRSRRIGSDSTTARLLDASGSDESPLSLVLVAPSGTQDLMETTSGIASLALDWSGLAPVAFFVRKIGYARGFCASFAEPRGALLLRLHALMSGEPEATFASGLLSLAKSLAGLVPPGQMSPEELKSQAALRSLSVERDRQMLTLTMNMTELQAAQ